MVAHFGKCIKTRYAAKPVFAFWVVGTQPKTALPHSVFINALAKTGMSTCLAYPTMQFGNRAARFLAPHI